MTSDGNTQIEKVTTSLVRAVTSEDPPNLIIICDICVPRIESYNGSITLVVRLLDVYNLAHNYIEGTEGFQQFLIITSSYEPHPHNGRKIEK